MYYVNLVQEFVVRDTLWPGPLYAVVLYPLHIAAHFTWNAKYRLESLKWCSASQHIRYLWAAGHSQKEIAAQVGCNQSTVSRELSRPLQQSWNKAGQTKKASAASDSALRRITISNMWYSTWILAEKWSELLQEPISRSTIYRRLRCMDLWSHIPCTKPLLNAKQKNKRLRFARKYSEWTEEDWRKVVFSYESKFVIGFGIRGPQVWRWSNERHHPSRLKTAIRRRLLCSSGDVSLHEELGSCASSHL